MILVRVRKMSCWGGKAEAAGSSQAWCACLGKPRYAAAHARLHAALLLPLPWLPQQPGSTHLHVGVDDEVQVALAVPSLLVLEPEMRAGGHVQARRQNLRGGTR